MQIIDINNNAASIFIDLSTADCGCLVISQSSSQRAGKGDALGVKAQG